MEALEKEVESLKAQLNTPSISNSLPSPRSWSGLQLEDAAVHFSPQPPVASALLPRTFPSIHRSPSSDGSPGVVGGATVTVLESTSARLSQGVPLHTTTGTSTMGSTTGSLKKRSRAHFEAATPPTIPDLDPISAGLITLEAAESYFHSFFSGCDRYVPVFDPLFDTLESVRGRSTLLFSTICWVGCRVLTGSESHQSRLLGVHTQRMLNVAIAAAPCRGGIQAGLETVQALLVRACYAPERSLLVAVATRMALEMGLPEAYGVLSARCVSTSSTDPKVGIEFAHPSLGQTTSTGCSAEKEGDEDSATLMRKTRTWLHLLMLGQILHVDAGGPPGFRFLGAARRCRILLGSPYSTGIDLHLFSQVELNSIRAKIHSALSQYGRSHPPAERDDDEIMEMVRDAEIDINVWFDDWTRIYEKHKSEMPWLAPNLAVQRCWADSMAMCCALKAAGIENVSAMSATQRTILCMAKRSLRQHLDIVLEEPRVYLRSIRYAMDFVWAKNAFCYLLLLKLSILLPDDDDDVQGEGGGHADGSANAALVEKGRVLVDELSKAGGGLKDEARNNTGGLYLHLVRVSIDKFSHATRRGSHHRGAPAVESQQGHVAPDCGSGGIARQTRRESGQEAGWPPPSSDETQTELESFVPEQFVFEWDFPGITFFSSPTYETGWLDELLAGAFDGATDIFNHSLGWASMDFNLS
ncbi:uncharacterized protein B0T15DRAFT_258300 [Chaetomium strumarium]|uniref:Transcription factor domain-containing protein n=1 Tax=Chaetomium strumarium TaxID=1170767 RepID=A0AAJ0GMX6_9PEZI|nr:hypothetical protein B0T15DRAFT_258300 [Chaetomium strumarium]